MIPIALATMKTRDGITLDGMVVESSGRTRDLALIWVHGLSSNFSAGHARIRELAAHCRKNRIAFLCFNTRGHDVVARGSRTSRALKFSGAAFERFEDCVHDIRAVVLLAKRLGYKRVILAGHSTGANKALYYAYKTRDRAVKGLALIAPISDIVAMRREIGATELVRSVRVATRLKQRGTPLMPFASGIYTPQRFLSLYRPGSAEDVFPYHNPRARWKELRSVHAPIAVAIGSRDEHLDRPARKLVEVFQQHAARTKSFTGIVIPYADHGFKQKEDALAQEIANWIKRAIV